MKTKYKYHWHFNFLKTSEGGQGVTTASQMLRRMNGIKVQTGGSRYVGYSLIQIFAVNKDSMRRAFFNLKEIGYISSIKEEMRMLVKQF